MSQPFRKALTILIATLTLLAGTAIAGSPAHADDGTWDECSNVVAAANYQTEQDGGYWYTVGYNVPSSEWSDCEDISITAAGSGALTVRIRFYPKNCGVGCNYANSWKSVCHICWVAAATDVINGTHFRVEFRTWEYTTMHY